MDISNKIKPLSEYPGYGIHEDGSIWSLGGLKGGKGGSYRYVAPKKLSLDNRNVGNPRVTLFVQGKRKRVSIVKLTSL